jgi:hypothetical protein
MKYRLSHAWPVGGVVIPGGVIIDDDEQSGWASVVKGAIPPPDVTPLTEATRAWLVAVYSAMPDHSDSVKLLTDRRTP